jgi:hypothetical protein
MRDMMKGTTNDVRTPSDDAVFSNWDLAHGREVVVEFGLGQEATYAYMDNPTLTAANYEPMVFAMFRKPAEIEAVVPQGYLGWRQYQQPPVKTPVGPTVDTPEPSTATLLLIACGLAVLVMTAKKHWRRA